MSTTLRSGFFQVIHTFSSKGAMLAAGFLVSVLTSRNLGPDGKGALAMLLTIPTLLVSFGEFGIRQSTALLVGRKKFSRPVIESNLLFIYFCTTLTCLTIISVADWHMGLLRHGVVTISAFALLIPIMLYQNFVSGFLLAGKRIEQINSMQMITPLLLVMELGALAAAGLLNLQSVSLAYLAAQLGGLLYLLCIHPVLVFPRYDREVTGVMLKTGILYAAGLFVQSLNYRADILILGNLRGDSSVGIYSVGVSMCELLKAMPLSVGVILFSRAVNTDSARLEFLLERVLLTTRVTFAFSIGAAIIMGGAAYWLVPLLFGAKFQDSVAVIWALLPGVTVLSVFATLHLFVSGQGMPQLALYAFLPALAVNILLNLLLIPKYDYVGAAIASTISYSLAAAIYGVIFLKRYKLAFTIGNLLPNKEDGLAVYRTIFGKLEKIDGQ